MKNTDLKPSHVKYKLQDCEYGNKQIDVSLF